MDEIFVGLGVELLAEECAQAIFKLAFDLP